ncbi:hypothetical protein DV515_00008066, partial [Chloebia gouldiae]
TQAGPHLGVRPIHRLAGQPLHQVGPELHEEAQPALQAAQLLEEAAVLRVQLAAKIRFLNTLEQRGGGRGTEDTRKRKLQDSKGNAADVPDEAVVPGCVHRAQVQHQEADMVKYSTQLLEKPLVVSLDKPIFHYHKPGRIVLRLNMENIVQQDSLWVLHADAKDLERYGVVKE